MKIHKTSHVNSRNDKKNGGVGVLSTISSIHKCVFHSHKNQATRVKKNSEKKKKNKEMNSLGPNHEVVFFLSGLVSFPPK